MKRQPEPKPEHEFKIECFLCGLSFQFAHGQYDGRKIPAWGIMVCNPCFTRNWDGIVTQSWPHLVPYLESREHKIELNAKGWLDWPR